MDFEQLKTFLTVVDVKSFSKAAEILHITQSTVTTRIQTVESFYGGSLLIRDKKAIKLTPLGIKLFPYLNRQMDLWAKSKQVALEVLESPTTFTLAGTYSIWRENIIDAIKQSLSPVHTLKLITEHSSVIIDKVLDGTIDIGFVYNKPINKNINSFTIIEDTIGLYAPTDIPIDSIENIRELSELPWIHLNWGYDFETWIKNEFEPNYLEPLIEVGHSDLEIKLINELKGIGFLPDGMVKNTNLKFKKIPITNQKTFPKQKIHLIYKKVRENEDILNNIIAKFCNY
ncbi:LysR family transcriptional regulator [Guptibacillus spartinae]|uniref:LysR family transcriptional regulator n=1 Tax=Guptibacillus spartinae TaxID=3025679 RepID=UPI00235EF673|nr:LysR family transcriptional regulator [Pseudalkalibacillus spartinae]